MDYLASLLSWWYLAAEAAIYMRTLAFYQMFLHPLAKFSGPKLAAITRYYEAYFGICAWTYEGFSAKGATICATDHHVHKARRLPLNPFFSKAKVASQQGLIRRNIIKLCDQILNFSKSKLTINLGAVISAFARDASTEFILGRNYNSLDREDFNFGMMNVFQDYGHIWRVTKHIMWFGPIMMTQKASWWLHRLLQMQEHHAPRTIVHEILESNLPPAEKAFERVFDEVATVTAAGFETTASVLGLIVYHVFSSPEILQRLRHWNKLPYLTSVLTEGMRLSPAIAMRMARIAPDRDIVYGEWCTPAGTPVGMTTLLMHTDKILRKNLEKTYAPFLKGTGNCMGMYLAWAEMYMAIAALV
ncbi:cytochrome P450 [Bisporella sp. PMI_857]|nr:cytochrome P450 [Bisporella sp. PMI_857]